MKLEFISKPVKLKKVGAHRRLTRRLCKIATE